MSEQDVKPETESPPEDSAEAAAAADAEVDMAQDDAAPPDGEAPIPSMTADASDSPAPEMDPQARIAELETLAAEANDRALRALAEAENVRRRAERDKQDASKYAVTGFARDILSVGDNLRRALDSIEADARKSSDAMETLATGVEMTERDLLAVLERHAIKRIDPLGQRFDSNQHEALFEIPDESQTAGTVAQVIEVGYMLHDRLLRPAKVGVTKGGPKPEPATQPTPDQAAGGEAAANSEGNKAYEQDADATGGKIDEEL